MMKLAKEPIYVGLNINTWIAVQQKIKKYAHFFLQYLLCT